jgi:hypothetical protein
MRIVFNAGVGSVQVSDVEDRIRLALTHIDFEDAFGLEMSIDEVQQLITSLSIVKELAETAHYKKILSKYAN